MLHGYASYFGWEVSRTVPGFGVPMRNRTFLAQGGLPIRRRLSACTTWLSLVVGLACLAYGGVDSTTYVDEIKYLASPELKGRATPSPELEKAANYIVGKFKSFGLQPPDGKSYEQAYTVHAAAKLGPNNHFSF